MASKSKGRGKGDETNYEYEGGESDGAGAGNANRLEQEGRWNFHTADSFPSVPRFTRHCKLFPSRKAQRKLGSEVTPPVSPVTTQKQLVGQTRERKGRGRRPSTEGSTVMQRQQGGMSPPPPAGQRRQPPPPANRNV